MASLSSDTLAARPVSSGPMLYVSLLVELLRSRPELLFWMATLAPRTAARQLARGDRVRSVRAPPLRHLSVVAGLRRDELLGGVRAGPRHRRRASRGDGGAADDRHHRVFAPHSRVRRAGAGDAAHRD